MLSFYTSTAVWLTEPFTRGVHDHSIAPHGALLLSIAPGRDTPHRHMEGVMSNFVYVLFAVAALLFLGLAAAGYLSSRRLPKI